MLLLKSLKIDFQQARIEELEAVICQQKDMQLACSQYITKLEAEIDRLNAIRITREAVAEVEEIKRLKAANKVLVDACKSISEREYDCYTGMHSNETAEQALAAADEILKGE